MERKLAERLTDEYLKPIYSFALKRCTNLQDAEDLSQEIALRAFRSLIAKDDIERPDKFIWTIAHNTLNSYYRSKSSTVIGVPIDDMAELLPCGDNIESELVKSEEAKRLRSEIAYLSKMQRKIVIAYYFENKKQEEIAKRLSIPLGTVKWHLFEAKKDLKVRLSTMRQTNELNFNPIKFGYIGISGSAGTTPPNNFFRSALSQNIAYCVRHSAKSINEIADALSVSPVYVESEVEYLEEYGFLIKIKDKYIINFILTEPSEKLLTLQNDMHKSAADIFANELFDELTACGILDDDGILCGQTDGEITLNNEQKTDKNFLLWALIPYIAAISGEDLMDNSISFEQAATIRPDGGQNLVHAEINDDDVKFPDDYVYMNNWCGPCWNATERHTLWQVDSQWSDKRVTLDKAYEENALRTLRLFERELDGSRLSKDEYTYLAERGFIKINGDYDGDFKSSLQIVTFANKDIVKRLVEIGDKIKQKHKAEFDALKAPYIKAMLSGLPEHIRKMLAFELQYLFCSDGLFLLHCINTLLENGKLKLPTDGQKKSLTTLIIPR